MSKEHARNTLNRILPGFMASASDSVKIKSDQNVSIQLIETAGTENGAEEPAKDGVPAAIGAEDGIPPTFTEKPKIIPNESGTLVTMKFRVRAKPKAEMQWYKGNQKIHEDSKFKSKYIELGNDEYEVLLEILKPTADDGGDYKCVVKNDLGQLQAKLNLNIEAEPATPTPAASVVGAPTFTEKPKIETLEGGKRVQMIVRYKAEARCQCQWFFKESKVVESTTTKVIHEKRESYYECRLEMTETTQEHAGIYKCIVKNEQGEINANLTLNIQVAPEDQVDSSSISVSERKESTVTRKTSTTTVMEETAITSTKRKKSVILQCKVQGESDVKIQWAKDGQEIASTETSRESRFSIERKKSDVKENETIVSLEIMEASVEDKGNYELLATTTEGQEEKQTVALTEEAIVASLAAQPDEADAKPKKKKKIVKKKKKKEEKKQVQKPELSSYLRSLIKKEGESIDLQCRLEEEMEEGECKVQWFFNDTELEDGEEFVLTFDGTYAKLFIARCTMEHMGQFKCVISNEAGSDETAGKVTVKPDETKKEKTPPKQIPYSQRKKSSATGEAPKPEGDEPEGEPGEMFKMPKKEICGEKASREKGRGGS